VVPVAIVAPKESPGTMKDLTDFTPTELHAAMHCAERLLTDYRAYLPGPFLVTLLSKLEDDLRDALGIALDSRRSTRVTRHQSLDEMTTHELADAIECARYLTVEFGAGLDDPELSGQLGKFHEALIGQAEERRQIQDEIGQPAGKAS
jgi:hypothetical protein